ncbi:galectin-4-like isoform X11 [Cyprinodon tularosa]|uniref:galectin-4-like isoform X11 n=1 Tax=Cyprinodon tularosa TaxID=77115 RepID=UPI0018E288BB|nr:galectin-4-like isoform X11 [Cyprinodon tularosa]
MTFVAPPGYQPVYNPRIPYLGPIYGGLREGVSIYIQGSVPEDITRFLINLLSEESESGDIALHFNPRFDGWDKVVFNSRTNGSWGSEEKIRRMPFSKGEAFELVIMITSEGFQTNVNGKEFFMFPHRIPVERVRAIQVAGDVSIQTINIIGGSGGGTGPGGMGGGYPGGGYPGAGMAGGYPGGPGGNMAGGFPGSHLPGMGGQPVYNPTVPYYAMIPGGMCPKRTIIIRGMVPYAAKRMGFNLVVSRSRDIAFHMNPRVKEGVVVRNTRIGEKWGKEERELTTNPFVEGQYFDMSIRCGNQRFKVFVNGQHLFDFSHRISFNEIDKLEIEGEVQISYIHF